MEMSRFPSGFPSRPSAIALLALLLVGAMVAAADSAPTPPGQPPQGPGGSRYQHARVSARSYGTGPTAYWIFEPAEPAPKSAPLVVFNHGWLLHVPGAYAAWTDHLVKRGNIVVYPAYQDSPFTPADRFTPNAIRGVKDAIRELQTGAHVRPELDKFAIVGHSAGGVIAADMAVRARDAGLPAPKALMIVEPGRGSFGGKPNLPIDDYTRIPANLLMLVVIGETYALNSESWPAKLIYSQAPLPRTAKNFITIRGDRHGQPVLISDHMAACGKWGSRRPKEVDAMDYYGHWKPFDALCDAAFHGRRRADALGNTREQRTMGRWSDGVPVREPVVAE
jgi:pimeloyl-ACP methyl ester carboxylesterase